jgi:hypothetical protein
MTERHLDDAIDRAAREMMAVDADGAFRARLSARLDRARQRPGLFTWTRLGVAGAATVALALAILLPSRQSAPTPAPDTPASAAVGIPAPVHPWPVRGASEGPAVAAGASTPPVAPSRSRAVARADRRPANVTQQLPRGALTAAVVDDEISSGDQVSGAVAAEGRGIEPIFLAPLHTNEILPSPIVVRPLAPIGAVQLAPLFLPAERN